MQFAGEGISFEKTSCVGQTFRSFFYFGTGITIAPFWIIAYRPIEIQIEVYESANLFLASGGEIYFLIWILEWEKWGDAYKK